MAIEDGRAWQAFFADLNGMAGTFRVPESGFLRTTEVDFGTPEIDGAFVSGLTVPTRGWVANMANVLTKGQRIEIAGRMRMVMEDAHADNAGKAVIRFWPHARNLSDGHEVVWQYPHGVFRANSIPEFTWNSSRLQEGFQFSASEVILP